jgi:hypothetical protein
VLALLQSLSGLHTLHLAGDGGVELEAVGQLTGLRELTVTTLTRYGTVDLLLQLAKLKQLTRLEFHGRIGDVYTDFRLFSQVGVLHVAPLQLAFKACLQKHTWGTCKPCLD